MALTNNRSVLSDAGGSEKTKPYIGMYGSSSDTVRTVPEGTLKIEQNGPVTTFYSGKSLLAGTDKDNTNASSGGGNTTTYVYGGGGYDPSDLYASMLAERNALMQKNYQAALDQLRGAYESNVNSLKNQGADAMREAYINMMMNKRGLNNNLASAGINGGATESVMDNLYNTYANDRNKIARTINESLEEAGRNYGNNVANLGINYNNDYSGVLNDYYSQLAAAKMSLANQLQPITTRTSSNTSTTPTTVAATTPTVNRSSVVNSLRGYNNYDDAVAALGAMNLNLSADDWAAILTDLQNMYPTRANAITGNQGGYIRNGVTGLAY